jgi:hypothetical protein
VEILNITLFYLKVKNGKIVAENCCAPYGSQVKDILRLRPIFEIFIQDKQVISKCLTGVQAYHDGIVKVINIFLKIKLILGLSVIRRKQTNK